MSEAYVLFTVGSTHYAIPALQIQQVELLEPVTRVPDAPAFIDGVVYLRGQVVPVMNLRRRFGLEPAPQELSHRLIVVQHGARVVGLAVDSARDFVSIAPDALQPAPETLAGPGQPAEAVAQVKDRLVVILNLARLLEPEAAPVKETP